MVGVRSGTENDDAQNDNINFPNPKKTDWRKHFMKSWQLALTYCSLYTKNKLCNDPSSS